MTISFKDTKEKIQKLIFQRMIGQVSTVVENYKNYLLKALPKDKDWYEYLKTHPKLIKHLQYDMSLLSTKNIEYIYLLGVKNNKFVFLIDGSKTDRAEFGEVFEPLNKKEFKKLKPHYFFHKKLKSIYLTYVYPIIINGKLKGILVVDVPAKILDFVKSLLEGLAKPVYLILFFSFGFVVLLLFFAYFDYKREKELIEKTEEIEKLNFKLRKINEELEKKVKEKVEELREKDVIILNQSKLVALGEMLNMIAHQWRQPLNSLSAYAITIELKNELGELQDSECKEFTKFVQNQSQKLSEIIDDFMSFSKPDIKEEEFYLKDLINEVLKIVEVQLKNHNIKIVVDVDKDLKVRSLKKELSHVLLNLIANARDALDKIEKKEKFIKIYTQKDENYIKIIVEDNAGGIPEEIKDRIFEPYFTTKDKSKGTGLGLYMSKKIVENRIKGELYFENTKEGVKFIIKIKEHK